MENPIRVLHVIGKMNRAGAETMIMNIYRKIDRTKIQFDFMVHTEEKCDFDDEILSLGGRIYRVPRFKGSNILSYKRTWNNFFKEHKEYKIIHGHIGSSAAIYLKIAKKYGLYTIAHSHNTEMGEGIKGMMYKIFSYPTRYIADYFFACSNLAGICRFGKDIVYKKNYLVLKNAIDSEKFIYNESIRKNKRKELGIEGKFVIGNVARFNIQKNHEYLIEIFKLVIQKNENAILMLVGDGERKELIIDKINKYKLGSKVIFTGVRDDVHDIMKAMDVFVFPSLYEGLPVTLIEAQAAGLPCLISDTITDEVCITPLVEKLPINKEPIVWAKKVDLLRNCKHEDFLEDIKNRGYDINTSVLNLEKFYLDI
nr:glycosyltransferase family 1 protein [uncultured Intestinibacter sp.]